MKKTLRKILTAFVLACVVFSACACGTLIKNDPNSKVIVVSIYNGGLGTDWFTPIEEEFEKDYGSVQRQDLLYNGGTQYHDRRISAGICYQ